MNSQLDPLAPLKHVRACSSERAWETTDPLQAAAGCTLGTGPLPFTDTLLSQEVCPYSGVIVNKEESRMRDHKNGRNYR